MRLCAMAASQRRCCSQLHVLLSAPASGRRDLKMFAAARVHAVQLRSRAVMLMQAGVADDKGPMIVASGAGGQQATAAGTQTKAAYTPAGAAGMLSRIPVPVPASNNFSEDKEGRLHVPRDGSFLDLSPSLLPDIFKDPQART
jgi:hypothetical protein